MHSALRAAHLTQRQLDVPSPRRKVHHKIVQAAPVCSCKELLNNTCMWPTSVHLNLQPQACNVWATPFQREVCACSLADIINVLLLHGTPASVYAATT